MKVSREEKQTNKSVVTKLHSWNSSNKFLLNKRCLIFKYRYLSKANNFVRYNLIGYWMVKHKEIEGESCRHDTRSAYVSRFKRQNPLKGVSLQRERGDHKIPDARNV